MLSERHCPHAAWWLEPCGHLPICLRCTTLKFRCSRAAASLLVWLPGEGTQAWSKAPVEELFLGP